MNAASGAPAPDAAEPPDRAGERAERGPNPSHYAAVLFGAGGALLLVVPLLPLRSRLWVALLIGCSAALTVALFAVRHSLRLRLRIGARGKPAIGGIRERMEPDGRLVLELPGQGLEPWGSDAWSVLLSTITLICVAITLDTPSWTIFVFLSALIFALGWRLRAARRDFIRIELDPEGWAIDALEGGRRVEIRGSGRLLPELLPEAMLLWSESGRIGTIRWELAPEERAWLAERLIRAADLAGSTAELGHGVDQPDPDHDGQEQEPKQAQ
jgi:hypothetical protein